VKPATITSGGLHIDFRADGSVVITTEGPPAATIQLSQTEFSYIVCLSFVQGFPHVPVPDPFRPENR
jgi:hypothetical protein